MSTSPRYIAVIVVSLFAVASGQSSDSSLEVDWSTFSDLPWRCVPVEGTATQGLCKGTTFEGGSWCTVGTRMTQEVKDTLPKETLEMMDNQVDNAVKNGVRSTRISRFNCIVHLKARLRGVCVACCHAVYNSFVCKRSTGAEVLLQALTLYACTDNDVHQCIDEGNVRHVNPHGV